MEKNSKKPVVAFQNAAFRIRDRIILTGTSWKIIPGQNWVVVGPNGAGKSTLVGALAGDVPLVQGSVERNLPSDRIGFVSFEFQRDLAAAEEKLHFARYFRGKPDESSSARRILFSKRPRLESEGKVGDENVEIPAEFQKIVSQLGLEEFLDRGVGMLSTGQMRKLLIARALVKRPKLLILDEPFDGLDSESRRVLADALENIMDGSICVVLVCHRLEEIPKSSTHAVLIKNGLLVAQGEKDSVLTHANLRLVYDKRKTLPEIAFDRENGNEKIDEIVISLSGGKASYGGVAVFENVNWTVRKGENWAILGPNGAGKSTLLNMISADNPQAYANELVVFGKPRGSGESIWDIKRRIGFVSSEFHIRYRKKITAFEVILSGFFDSVGLFRMAGDEQKKKASQWVENLGISCLKGRLFTQLSQGEQRLVLLARSMVKSPEILILDEPCLGLDSENRRSVLEIVQRIGSLTPTQLLFVTHYPEEIPGCATNVLLFQRLDSGAFTATPLKRQEYDSNNQRFRFRYRNGLS